ncbi:MAG: hypothetical protein ACUZ8H_10345 [Candidatus Anammoxibacter sp.]
MSKPTGNPDKWPTPEDRKAACQRFCDHISAGYSIKSWPEADNETVKRYIDNFPEDFSYEQISEAHRTSLLFWEKLGVAGVTGKLKGFNAPTWIFNMKNRAGWRDAMDHTNSDGSLKPEPSTNNFIANLPTDKLRRICDILNEDEDKD